MDPNVIQEQQVLWRLLTGQGSQMSGWQKFRNKLVMLMDQLVNVAKNLYQLEIKGTMSDENVVFAQDIIQAAQDITERAEYLELYGKKFLKLTKTTWKNKLRHKNTTIL